MNDLDTRALAWCNLGPLAAESSSIAADHLTGGAGVRKLRGTVNLDGVFNIAPGTVVQLAYSDGQNWLARLPLRLRVLSSSCNPLGRAKITSLSVGCDLAYFEDRKQPPSQLTARQANPNVPDAIWRVAAPPIPASWLVEKILTDLGLTAAGSIPLTNYITSDEFDMTAGYIEELDKLCASENYFAQMNESGQVEFISKKPALTIGPLITNNNLIDLNPINSGELPGEAVYATYSFRNLKPPENPDDEFEREKRNWERESSSSAGTYKHAWTRYETVGTGEFKPWRDEYGYIHYWITSGEMVQDEIFEVKGFPVEEEIEYIQHSLTLTNYDSKDRVISRKTTSYDQWGQSRSETYYTYRDATAGMSLFANQETKIDYGEIVLERTLEWSPLAPIRMSLGLQASYASLLASGSYQSQIKEVRYYKNKNTGITKTVTKSFVPFINTSEGSEVISRLRGKRQPWDLINDLETVATRLVAEPQEERIRTEREFGLQRRPPEAARTAEANQQVPTVESFAATVWLVGSAASQTTIELSPPYVSDDRIVKEGNVWRVIKSDASQKALAYAQNENALLLGYRNGNGIQVLPEMLPSQSFGVIYIRLNDCTGAFLADGPTWTIDPMQGVTATCDALFWGAVDGPIGNAWFPLPPGATSLPATVTPVTNANPKPANAISIPQGFNLYDPNLQSLFSSLPVGQAPVHPQTLSPATALQPYQETIQVVAGIGVGAFAEFVDWGATVPIQALAGIGAGAFASLMNSESALAGIGVGAFAVTESAPPANFSVTWTIPEDDGETSWITQAPTYSATPTTASINILYNVPEENYGLFVTYGAVFSGTVQSVSVAALVDGVSSPGLLYTDDTSLISPAEITVSTPDGLLPGPCVLTVIITVTKQS